MATLDAATVALKIANHNRLQATGVTGPTAVPFAVSAGDIIPSSVDMSYVNIGKGTYAAGGSFVATLSGVVADGVNADSLDATGAVCISGSFKGAMLANSVFTGATIAGTSFQGANLAQADLRSCGATGITSFKDADLRNARLNGILFGASVTPFGA